MYYTIRPAGPRTKKEQIQHYLILISYLVKWIASLTVGFFAIVSWLTGNYGALALLALFSLITGLLCNTFNLRSWLPGWRNGSLFTRIIALTSYMFIALAILLIYNP